EPRRLTTPDVLTNASPADVEPLITWSSAVRTALAERFGPALRARTTEEIAADRTLAGQLGEESFERLGHFLASADRVKFAAEPSEDTAWEGWAREFVAGLAAAGARSKITGK